MYPSNVRKPKECFCLFYCPALLSLILSSSLFFLSSFPPSHLFDSAGESSQELGPPPSVDEAANTLMTRLGFLLGDKVIEGPAGTQYSMEEPEARQVMVSLTSICEWLTHFCLGYLREVATVSIPGIHTQSSLFFPLDRMYDHQPARTQ